MRAILEPNSGISSFFVGESIDNYTSVHTYNFLQAGENESWDEYDFFDEIIEIYVDKKSNLIESIACRKSCFHMDIELIGFDFDDFLKILNVNKGALECEKLWMAGDEQQTVYEFEALLLQVWVDFKNKIRAIFVG